MEKYSEEELLMLSNFVYLDASKKDGTIREILSEYETPYGTFTKESVSGMGIGGGLDAEQVSDLFTRMKSECEKEGSSFGELSASRRLEQEDIRGVCYTDSSDENAVVVFRGTGGTKEAWSDNLYGAFSDDTRLQMTADDFVRYECGGYDNLTLTGHSKGGNLSQYVTLKNGDKVSKCVSFDGQGFGSAFLKNNEAEINENAHKIKSICAYNDYVNVLLFCVAGTVMFVPNEADGVDAHSSYYLLSSNDFDENGNFLKEKNQSVISKAIGKLAEGIESVMEMVDDADNFIFCTILGEAVANLVMAQNDGDVAKGIDLAAKEGAAALSVKMSSLFDRSEFSTASLPSDGFCFDPIGVRRIVDLVGQRRQDTISIIAEIEELEKKNDYGLTERIYTNMAMEKIIDKLKRIDARLLDIEEIMGCALRRYASNESFIAHQMISDSL